MKNISQLIIILSSVLGMVSCGNVVKPMSTSLIGVDWKLVSLNGVSVERKPPLTLRFESGRASGFSGCNRYSMGYDASNKGGIVFGSIRSTKMRCHQVMARDIERQFLSGLRTANVFILNQAGLIIKGTEGSLQFSQ